MMINLYVKNGCPQCKMTERFLNEHNINYTEYNVSEKPELVPQLKKRGFMGVPVVDIENGETFKGFRPDKLNQLLIFNNENLNNLTESN